MPDKVDRWARNAIAPGLALSLALHLTAILAFGLLIKASPTSLPPSETSIAVEILDKVPVVTATKPAVIQNERKAAALRAAMNRVLAKKAEPVIPHAPAPKGDGMVRAKALLSSKVLADPRSKDARLALGQLGSDDRVIQLCNVEAMEQVHRWKSAFQPDFIVAYALADTKLSGVTLKADGAALRSKRHWYGIRFKCEVTADLQSVAAFEFALGTEIPRSEWATHSLPTDDKPSD